MPQRALDPGAASETVSIRVPHDVKISYQRRAKQSGRSLSEWVRDQLDHDAPLPQLQKGSSTQVKAPPAKHVHEETSRVTFGDHEVPRCRCGAIEVAPGRWV